ncbi:hypothetical protein EDD37DRAFT_183921 [Exophiala viscosa]|uniref:Carboxymuconolactone decarboxylase-like domain-containing protein n=1 Tax=Exophiala viscosa TaxID=2486360 RepID=A0AAN6DKC3_9EURO|nr:hypothetical protein EDD36DRAFT_106603 [Exophiala viscosa]KAI1620066.1 hypothetical protein EDD37DRAFT_183921 [Exophiala viscosa]
MATTRRLSREEFYATLAKQSRPSHRPSWYLSAFACLAALNHSEEVASLYTLLLESYIAENERMHQTRMIREALTTLVGILGAAKVGNALRSLSDVTPDDLRDDKCYRKDDDHELAVARGKKFIESVYGKSSENKRGAKSQKACPDYDFIMTELLYSHVFSFPDILPVFETGQIIVSAVLASDCPLQASGHMLGMMRNGATREEVNYIRDICVKMVDYWGVKPFADFVAVPAFDPPVEATVQT